MVFNLYKRYVFLFALILWQTLVFAQKKITPEEYIETYKDIAMKEMREYKIPASITLAQGIFESGSGNSDLARKGKNHFGIKCHKDWTGKTMKMDDDEKNECFRVYASAEDSYRDHSKFLAQGQRYAFLFDLEITNYEGWAKGLKKAGYATFPNYAIVIINLIKKYELTQYDELALKGKIKDKKVEKPKKIKVKKQDTTVYVPLDPSTFVVVGKTTDERYIRENNGVKFVYAKKDETVHQMAQLFQIYDYQLERYNNLWGRKQFREGEMIYIEPKRRKAAKEYKYHTIEKGQTLSYVSQLYAVKLNRIYKMNGLDEKSVLQIGQNIRLR